MKSKNGNMLFHLIDDVIDKIGEDNVLQVITDNASNYKLTDKLLMEKRKNLY